MKTEVSSRNLLLISREPSTALGELVPGPSAVCHLNVASNGLEAVKSVRSVPSLDMVLLDLAPGDIGAFHTIRWLREVRPELPVVLLLESSRDTTEIRRWSARDQLSKPIKKSELMAVLDRHIPNPEPNSEFEDLEEIGENLFFVASSPVMRRLRSQAELLAKMDVPVLILGEKGSGKDAVARLIHKRSIRSECRFLKVNCAALSGDLLESHLFDYHTLGASGTRVTKQNQFELCDKGTLFLDEVSELPKFLQLKLPEVFGHREFADKRALSIRSDVRILAAMSSKFEQALSEKLDVDIFYRLSAFALRVPPLRERIEEIPLLLGYFINHATRQYGLPNYPLSPSLVDACQHHTWPGNLRELKNFVKRYLLTGEVFPTGRAGASKTSSQSTRQEHGLERELFSANTQASLDLAGSRNVIRSARQQAEKTVIITTLERTRWNRKAAARLLNISYRGLLYKIEEYRLNRPDVYFTPASGQAGPKPKEASSQSPNPTPTPDQRPSLSSPLPRPGT